MTASALRVGTSGWHYEHWVGPFYPEGASGDDLFRHYRETFDTVEINNTFYQLPDRSTLEHWRELAPRGFLFSCKASRYVTHMKKLKDPAQSIRRFFDRVEVLGDALGPVVFQLPPRWHRNMERLEGLLDALPSDHRYAFEFRDRSWFAGEVIDTLAEHDAAFCIYDIGGERSPVEVTTDFVYLRLHGPGAPYEGRYDGRTLHGWARRFDGWLSEGRDVFCYLDNDQEGHAPEDARRLLDTIGSS
jgi:uncharacterized protein YecE (DUF72 family)